MIHRVIEFSIYHRWVVLIASIGIAIGGMWALVHTPVDAIPDLSESQVIVFADWHGHLPHEIESRISRKLTTALRELKDVRVVRSSSDVGFSMVHVIFDDGIDIRTARKRVAEQLAVQNLELPTGVTPYLAPESPATGQIYWYVLEGRGYDLAQLREIQDAHIKQKLAVVPGVAEVATVGGFPTEYQVLVDPQRLAACGVSLGQIIQAVSRAQMNVSGSVERSPSEEYAFHVSSSSRDPMLAQSQVAIDVLQNLAISKSSDGAVRLSDVGRVSLGPGPRRGVLEQDGNEVVGGVVSMRYGANPLEVIRALREKIIQLQPNLPKGVRIVTGYDRTPLIHAAIGTVTKALLEAMVTATICVLVVMWHFRTSLVISFSLPLSVLASFLGMWVLRSLNLLNVETNIMSLAGLVISIGVLVDSSIVMAENVMHTLHHRFESKRVTGDVRAIILPACQTVGRPIFFSVLIMLLSFLPVFALGGMEGKMFRPLALTKSLALAASAVLAITLVPALCTVFVRGRLRGEQDNWLVRSLIDAYRPLLNYLLDRPAALIWVLAATFLVGLAPLGDYPVSLSSVLGYWTPLGKRPCMMMALVCSLGAVWWFGRRTTTRIAMFASLIFIALVAERTIEPLSSEILTPLDEQTVMDMPITYPRVTVSQATDDLKARDMVLCRFPEVAMVMGKAGRAETPTDPAPIDMIETMVNFRPAEFWPRRKLDDADANRLLRMVHHQLVTRNMIAPASLVSTSPFSPDATAEIVDRFDALMREFAYQRNQELLRALGRDLALVIVQTIGSEYSDAAGRRNLLGEADFAAVAGELPADVVRALAIDPASERVAEIVPVAHQFLERRLKIPTKSVHRGGAQITLETLSHRVQRRYRQRWTQHIRKVNGELAERGPESFVRLALETLLRTSKIEDARLADEFTQLLAYRTSRPKASAGSAHHGGLTESLPDIDPLPILDGLQRELVETAAANFSLSRKDRLDLVGFSGEMDRALQMPGWTNVWTMPIQNRVDMLATGVNTTVGIRVLGDNLDDVITGSERIAEVVRQIHGASDVVVDQMRGKGYLSIRVDPQRAALAGVDLSEANETVAVATGGVDASANAKPRPPRVVRIMLPPSLRGDVAAIRRLPIPASIDVDSSQELHRRDDVDDTGPIAVGTADNRSARPVDMTHRKWLALEEIAEVEFTEGPAAIKGENGRLRNYVRLNVRDRDPIEFVTKAKQIVAEKVELPHGVQVEWTGQFEPQQRARQTLMWILPLVVISIFVILYLTYRDWADATLMLLAVPGAIVGGLLAQSIFGYKFSVTVWIGYIACFGMATATGIIMLVYLREAIARAGGLEKMTHEQLRGAVLDGAVHRLRPKLLTEATTIIGLAPMLWATGVGSEVIAPMAAPVLGGILIADEVIDLFLPVMFYWVRSARWRRLHAGAARS